MQKRLRDLLRTVVTGLRHTLTGGPNGQRGDLDRELERLGVAPDGTVTPFDALPNSTAGDRKARRAAEAQLSAAPAGNKATVRSEIVERAAYTWINRLLALRAMEARGLINPVLRADPAYDGLSEALFVLRQTNPQAASGPDAGWWTVIEDACREQAASLPGLFDLADPSASLRPSTPALLRCVALMGSPPAGYSADEADAAFADPDAIGWAYQFYQEEAKARTYAKLNAGGKAATRAEIASVTQLFTEPYMVKWLLQNSVGRTYHELYPDSRLPETWEYYIRDLPKDDGAGGDDRRPPIDDLDGLTFMDPCMGSGHFEREAFDVLAAMYREQRPGMSAAEIANRVLSRHLHGIDLDPRAAQLAALTLYLRASELVAEERRSRRLPGPGTYRPPAMNLATTPTGLTPGSLERHLQRHPEDRVYRPLLEGIFAALEQADVLGSLLRPGEQLDAAICNFRARADGQMQLVSEDADLNRLLAELAQHDPGELKRVLLDRVARSFAAEASDTNDVGSLLFGREAGEGLRLLQLLARRYVVIATNPPYADVANLEVEVRQYLNARYSTSRRNLYAAFLSWGLDHAEPGGRFSSVAPQSYLFNKEYSELRERIVEATSIEAVVSLGRYAFSEVDPPVNQVLAVLRSSVPLQDHTLVAVRLSSPRPSEEQASLLHTVMKGELRRLRYTAQQKALARIAGKPLAYWVGPGILNLLQNSEALGLIVHVHEGVGTREDRRFLRYHWEVTARDGDPFGSCQARWYWCAKGGGYKKWTGLEWFAADWQYLGARIKAFPGSRPQNEQFLFLSGLTYSMMGRGKLSVRRLDGAFFNDSAPSIMPLDGDPELAWGLMAALNTHLASYLMRLLTQSNQFRPGYLRRLPIAPDAVRGLAEMGKDAFRIKSDILASDLTERLFQPDRSQNSETAARNDALSAALLVVEALAEATLASAYGLDVEDVDSVFSETATLAGWYHLLPGTNSISTPISDDDVSALIRALAPYKKLRGPELAEADSLRIKSDIAAWYALGPGASDSAENDSETSAEEDESSLSPGSYLPMPAETFLEELSKRVEANPISVYWLLQELRAEGVRCKPEELRLLEDRLTVLVLRLLGHRWPRQIEAGEPVPPWADPDGIIPLTPIAGETALAERLRDRLRDEDGDRGAQQVEALLLELTGLTLEEWLRRTFFSRHVRQFKHRPIAWHLASTPSKDGPRRGKVKREAAFQCLLYYHACRGDVLARLRAHYVDPLIRLETAAAADARRRGDETATAIAVSRVHELEEFADRLRAVAEEGFTCAELDRLLEGEPLDRWSGDGIVAPASADELAAQERAWRVDINDGVRVNIAPLQLAGLLASEVLRPDDARKAIADRARWRSDERRWVREGVLPRCGWMDEDVPESPRWTERAPEREAEAQKLAEKRRAVMEKLA